MHVLIADLADLTNLTKTDENKSPADLNRIVQHTLIVPMRQSGRKKCHHKCEPITYCKWL